MSGTGAMMLLVTSMAITGANVPLAKLLSASLPTDSLLALRFAIASVVLAIPAACERGPRLRQLDHADWVRIAVLALLGSVLFTWAVVAGVQETSGITAGIILSALPAVIVVMGALLGSRLRWGEAAMVVLAVAGLVLVQAPAGAEAGGAETKDSWRGNILMGLAVVCEASFVIAARAISRKVAPLRLSLAVSSLSLAVCLPFALPGLLRLDVPAIPLHVWTLLVWYALTASALCTVLWYRGASHVEPWAAGLATAAVPVSAMIVSVLLLGEQVTVLQIAGAALVVGAIIIGMLTQRSASSAPVGQ